MAEAEYLLPSRQRNVDGELTSPVNGEKRVSSAIPPESPQTASWLPADPGRPPSPNASLNGLKPCPVQPSAALQPDRSKACRKKKKCLSDIFGHIVGGLKELPGFPAADQFQTAAFALTKEPEDSPYADLDSVAVPYGSKRRADVAQSNAKFTDKTNHSAGPRGAFATKRTIGETNCSQSTVGCSEPSSSLPQMHSTLSGSSRLITRALKPEEDIDIDDDDDDNEEGDEDDIMLASSQPSTDLSTRYPPDTHTAVSSTASKAAQIREASRNVSMANQGSPKRRARKPDKKQIRNGSLKEPKSMAPVEVKIENVFASSPTSPSVSPLEAIQDVKEVTFKSLAKDSSGGGSSPELNVFRPDSNYKFSTFLMLLKDMHDTREKEGKPLTLPPSPALIKEEPLVMPTSVTSDHALCDTFTKRPEARTKTKPIMKADADHCEDFPVASQTGSADKQRRKQRSPAKLKVGMSAVSSNLGDLPHGMAGHADLAAQHPSLPDTAGPSLNYLEKNLASSVAPKKRWQLVEDEAKNKACITGEASAQVTKGSHVAASPDIGLGAEGQTEASVFFTEKGSTSGKELRFQTLS